MRKILVSLLVLVSMFVGNFSAQAKTFRVVNHIVSEHFQNKQEHHHHHENGTHHKHESKKKNQKEHCHDAELSISSNVSLLSVIDLNEIIKVQITDSQSIFSYNEIIPSHFLDSLFRPPIA
jgi:Ni/Co efflux regulator RcnB